jgi:predicted  nucleic acid-binding Zn-ribbon protein
MTFLLKITTAETSAAEALAQAKAEGLARALDRLAAAAAEITGQVPQAERDSWATKAVSARAYLADAASADQLAMLQAEAAVTGEAVADLAAAIVAMADAYASIAAQLAGLRRKTRAVIEAATTPAQVQVALAALDAALLTLGAG